MEYWECLYFTTHLSVMSTHSWITFINRVVVLFVFVKPANERQPFETQTALRLAVIIIIKWLVDSSVPHSHGLVDDFRTGADEKVFSQRVLHLIVVLPDAPSGITLSHHMQRFIPCLHASKHRIQTWHKTRSCCNSHIWRSFRRWQYCTGFICVNAFLWKQLFVECVRI